MVLGWDFRVGQSNGATFECQNPMRETAIFLTNLRLYLGNGNGGIFTIEHKYKVLYRIVPLSMTLIE